MSCAAHRIDAHALHTRQLNHEATVTDGKARHAMATTTYRHQEVVVMGETAGPSVPHANYLYRAGSERETHPGLPCIWLIAVCSHRAYSYHAMA